MASAGIAGRRSPACGRHSLMVKPFRFFRSLAFVLVSGALLLALPSGCSAEKEKTAEKKVRPPAVAGAFYPSDPKALGSMIDGFLARAKLPDIADSVVALVSPHAGYVYSGPVAAYGYALIKGRKYSRVVVIAPSHYEAFGFTSIYDGDAYLTPFGPIPVDKVFAKSLAAKSGLIKLSDRGHRALPSGGEHSIEVQLPFLQRVLGNFELVPIIMGDQNYEICRALGVALAELIQEPDTLIVVSSDLSHYHTYEEAEKIDHKTLTAIQEWDYLSMARNFQSRVWEACGGGPIIAAMIASERLGVTEARLLKYANSGDITGDKSHVVGYSSFAFLEARRKRSSAGSRFSLTTAEEAYLLEIARNSVETAVNKHEPYDATDGGFHSLDQERGAFVTLTKHGELRGCIGYVAPVKPLYITVRDVAALAARRDQRFRPVAPAELGDLKYEISVLSPLRRVLDTEEIQVGTHGLVMRQGGREGLLLPQVPVEEGWNRVTFLEQTCRKAGLPANAWRDQDTDIFLFTALVFGQDDIPGAVTAVHTRLSWPAPSPASSLRDSLSP